MPDRLTGGWYRPAPHRVRNLGGRGRLSFPFFLDPGFAAGVPPLPDRAAAADDGRRRWDGQDLRAFTGSYGDYLPGEGLNSLPAAPQRRAGIDARPGQARSRRLGRSACADHVLVMPTSTDFANVVDQLEQLAPTLAGLTS